MSAPPPDLASASLLKSIRRVERIATNALQFPIQFREHPPSPATPFPLWLFFRALPEAVYVIACFHASRDPTTWRRRG
jgi:hypothetical protein